VAQSSCFLLADERESECEAGQGVQCHTLKLQRS